MGQKLSILLFHRILPERDPLQPEILTAAEFRRILCWARRCFRILPLAEAVDRLERRTLPSRALALTFDDGYADNHDVALPLLRECGTPATFFIASGFLDGGRMWNDTVLEAVRRHPGNRLQSGLPGVEDLPTSTMEQKRAAASQLIQALKYFPMHERQERAEALAADKALPGLMMARTQVRKLAMAGMEIGAHTMNHPILARLETEAARDEIGSGKADLEALLTQPVSLFAFPNGKPGEDYTTRDVDLVREHGFRAAVSTAWGTAQPGGDLLQLPRFTPWDHSPARFFVRLGLMRLAGHPGRPG